MSIAKIIFYLLCLLCVSYFTLCLMTDYQNAGTRERIPFPMWVIDTIDLFIHEAGHFFFSIFGRFVYFLGGSLFQILLPLVAVIVFARSSLRSLPFTLYWTGQSMVNVSVYIADAPYQHLRLISRHALHDWHWLMNSMGAMEYSEDLAGVVNFLGLAVCLAGIGLGIYFLVKDGITYFSERTAPVA